MKQLEINIGTLVLSVNPALGEQARADYLPDSREVVMSTPFPEPFVIRGDQEVLVLHIEQVELRLSEEAVRQMLEKLPPEMLHRLRYYCRRSFADSFVSKCLLIRNGRHNNSLELSLAQHDSQDVNCVGLRPIQFGR